MKKLIALFFPMLTLIAFAGDVPDDAQVLAEIEAYMFELKQGTNPEYTGGSTYLYSEELKPYMANVFNALDQVSDENGKVFQDKLNYYADEFQLRAEDLLLASTKDSEGNLDYQKYYAYVESVQLPKTLEQRNFTKTLTGNMRIIGIKIDRYLEEIIVLTYDMEPLKITQNKYYDYLSEYSQLLREKALVMAQAQDVWEASNK